MAKKSSKHQSKPANTATFSNLSTEPTTDEPSAEKSAPNIITVPADSPPVSVSPPSNLKLITDTASIERLVGLAKDSPPDSALGIVWKYANDQGYQKGRIEVLRNLGKKLEEKFKEGETEGVKKGKEKYYGKGIVRGECDEHNRWTSAGHSQRCFEPVAFPESAGVQTNPMTTNTATSVQTSSFATMSQARTFVTTSSQTNALIVTAIPSTTASISTQTQATDPSTLDNDIIGRPKPTVICVSTQTDATIIKTAENRVSISVSTQTVSGSTRKSFPSVENANATSYAPNFTQTNLTTFTATSSSSQSTAFIGNTKNTKMDCMSEFSMDSTRFPSSTPSVVVSNSVPHSTTSTALETRSTTVSFTQKEPKVEKPPISIQTNTSSTPLHSSTPVLAKIEHTECSELENESMAFPGMSPPPALAEFETGTGFDVKFEKSQLDTVSDLVEPNMTVLGPETPSTIAVFTQKQPEMQKSTVSNENHPKTPISDSFSWAEDAKLLPTSSTTPTKYPRNLSCLRSTSPHPFSSLRRKRDRPKSRRNAQRCYGHSHSYYPPSCRHLPHHDPHTTFPISLDWDWDPRLADLSNALRALGWTRW